MPQETSSLFFVLVLTIHWHLSCDDTVCTMYPMQIRGLSNAQIRMIFSKISHNNSSCIKPMRPQVRVCTNMTNNPNLLTDRELEDVTAVFRSLILPHQCQYRPFCDKTNLSYIPTLSEIPSSGALKLVWGKQPFTQRWRQDSLMIALSTSTSDPDICRTCTRLWKCWDLTQLSRRSLKRRSSLKETGILEINFCTGGGHSKWDS